MPLVGDTATADTGHMGATGANARSTTNDDAIKQCLGAIEAALAGGDVRAARRIIGEARRALNPNVLAERKRLQLVGGVALTEREAETLHRLPDGSMSLKDIARDLDITRNTVKTHLKALYQKLGVHCRSEAIHRARELGLLPEQVAPSISFNPDVARTA